MGTRGILVLLAVWKKQCAVVVEAELAVALTDSSLTVDIDMAQPRLHFGRTKIVEEDNSVVPVDDIH